MNKLFTRLRLIFSNLTGKIAFYPSLIAFAGLCFAFIILYLEDQGISKFLVESAPSLVINDAETARSLLSTFIGGIISLMVFSFSMVMILLNQASSNYSPRILPGLISNKRHQVVLGFFIATLTYCIFILLSIKPTDNKYQLPGFAVLIAIILALIVLACFIYFIHAISEAIQITTIIKNIFVSAKDRLLDLTEETKESLTTTDFEKTDTWNSYSIDNTGYLQAIAVTNLKELANEAEAKFDILIAKGSFVLKGVPIVKSNKKLDDDQKDKLLSCFGFSNSEIVARNYLLGFKQLTEIAVKAMSPGINDPGTAITCIDYLTELFTIRMHKGDKSFIFDEDGKKALIRLRTIHFAELIYFVFAPLRAYCKQDVVMLSKMLKSLFFMLHAESYSPEYKECFIEEANRILEDAKKNIHNSTDIKRVFELAHDIKNINDTNVPLTIPH